MLEQNINVPDVLTRPLRFGDPEQIAALKIIEKEIEEKEEAERLMREGTLKNYQVTVSFSGDAEFVVQANSEREARELAQEGLGEEINNADNIEVDDISVYEITSKAKKTSQ